MQTSAPHRWQLAREPCFVLFWWWTGSTALSGLRVDVLNKTFWPFTASARTTRSKPFLTKPQFQKIQLGTKKHKVHHVLNKMLWPCTTSAHGACPFWLQCLSSDGEGVIHSAACFSMKTTSWVGAIRAKLICVVRACTRVIYSRAGFGQRLPVWLTGEPTCTKSFCLNWSRLPQDGFLLRNFVTPQVTTGKFGQIFVPHRKLQNLCRFR